MGYIEKRGKSSWRIVSSIRTAYGTEPIKFTIRMDPSLPESVQRRDAERELRNLEKRLAAQDVDPYTLRRWSEDWLRKYVATDCSQVTVQNYRYLLDSRILPKLGDKLLTELTPALLTDWLLSIRADTRKTTRKPDAALSRDRRPKEQARLAKESKLRKPLSQKTVSNYYGCMSAMLSTAVRAGYLEHNPMDRVKRPKLHQHQKQILTESQAAALIDDLLALPEEKHCYILAIMLALTCTLRLGEVCAISYKDVDFRKGTITISRAMKYTEATGTYIDRPKTDTAIRTVALPDAMLRLLRWGWELDYDDRARCGLEAERTGEPDRYHPGALIVHGPYGRPMNKDTPSKWFRSFARSHGYDITFHDLRHIHASILVAHGIDIAAIASRMGHSDATVTLHTYTHPFAAQDKRAAQVIDQLLRQASAPAVSGAPASDTGPAEPAEKQ